MGTRILLVDDHGIIRQGLLSLLNGQPDIEVIGQAEDGRKAVELVVQHQPDIVIIDVIMPNLNGIDATRQITRQFPKVKVIALSGHQHESFVVDMLQAGASAYVLKECLFDELLDAIHTVTIGGSYLSSKVTGTVVSNYVRLLTHTDDTPLHSLSEREREVLQLIAEGKSTKQIALELHLSTKAIEANRRNIMEKLHTHSIAELVRFALAGGLTSLEL